MDANRTLTRRLPYYTAAAMVVALMGCADTPQADDAVDGNEGAIDLDSEPAAYTLPDPNGTYFAEVRANGTGCPAGSWNTSISDDGQTFTTTFSQYETMVDWKTAVSVKDCQLAIKLHSPQGLSYSVQSFYYQGIAFLEQGVTGRQTARYYFQGNPVDSGNARTNLTGPYDDSYLFKDEVAIADAVWSQCGTERDLNVSTSVRLQNSSPRRNGYMNLSAVDGSAKLVMKLAWRKCEGSAPLDAGVKPDAGTPAADAGVKPDAGAPAPADAGTSGRRRRR